MGIKKRLTSLLLTGCLLLAMLPTGIATASALDGVSYLDYNEADGTFQKKTIDGCKELTSSDRNLSSGWYVVNSNVTLGSYRININGDVHLILADNCTLTASGNSGNYGINVINDNSLTIYAQSTGENMGSLIAKGSTTYSGIGGRTNQTVGKITINGGNINSTGSNSGAGIGGGENSSGGEIVINGGIVTAKGLSNAAGIGGGRKGEVGSITINGGVVNAIAGQYGAAIGGGFRGNGGEITINGGEVNTEGWMNAACIGGGMYGNAGKITINGGTVTANAKSNAAGIGNGSSGEGGEVIINGGTIMATGRYSNAGIGNASNGSGCKFSTGENGNAVIIASSISDQTGKENGTWSGLIVEGDTGVVYGTTVTPADDFTLDSSKTVTVPENSELVISNDITAVNNGRINVDGVLGKESADRIVGNKPYYRLKVINCTSNITDGYAREGTEVELTAVVPVGYELTGEWKTYDGVSERIYQTNVITMPSTVLSAEPVLRSAPTYTVTIPDTAQLGSTAVVSASKVNIPEACQLKVDITAPNNTFSVEAGNDSLSYSITKSNQTVNSGDTILTVEGGVADNFGRAILALGTPSEQPKYAGSYNGTLTFTVSLTNKTLN